LVTASNSGDFSASALNTSLNGGFLPTDSFLHRLPYSSNKSVILFLAYNISARTT
jgi:hypothetical protein